MSISLMLLRSIITSPPTAQPAVPNPPALTEGENEYLLQKIMILFGKSQIVISKITDAICILAHVLGVHWTSNNLTVCLYIAVEHNGVFSEAETFTLALRR